MKKVMVMCLVVMVLSSQAYASVEVRETVVIIDETMSTWTYTLTNNTNDTIWNWAVWFTENPWADSVTTDADGWVCTNLATQGYFPEQYVAEWPDVEIDDITDSTGAPLVGPAEEPGFYQTYAGNFTSANPKEYDPKYDAWLGAKFGWDGDNADIKTNVGIAPGQTGTLIVITGSNSGIAKSFSYNTTDYWYSKTCLSSEDLAVDFEAHGTVLSHDAEPTTVTEKDNGDGTYTYTLTNNTVNTIWNWAVWFTENPGATDVTTDDDWFCPFAKHGYFPQEYLVEHPELVVLDSNGQPLVGPDEEGGFYEVYADDFVSANPREYDKDLDVLIGGERGWDGYEADIRTNCGIAPGQTGSMTIASESMPGTEKSFSYNTIDYWFSMTSMDGPIITTLWCDFEASGTVTVE